MLCVLMEKETQSLSSSMHLARFRKRSLKREIKVIMHMYTYHFYVPFLQKKKKSGSIFTFDIQGVLKLLKYIIQLAGEKETSYSDIQAPLHIHKKF